MKGAPMSARARLWLDLALFGALFLAYNPAWTRIAVHEWLCVIAIVPLLFHIIINWDQTLSILRRFADLVKATPKVNLVVDTALFVVSVTVMLSGLLVSQYVLSAFGLHVTPTALWVTTHRWSADATMLLLLVHFALHWRWIVNCSKRLVRREQPCEDDPIVAIRMATRRLERQAPAPLQYATVPVRNDDRYRP
jgi:Domain of unknown function (DUF4405)